MQKNLERNHTYQYEGAALADALLGIPSFNTTLVGVVGSNWLARSILNICIRPCNFPQIC